MSRISCLESFKITAPLLKIIDISVNKLLYHLSLETPSLETVYISENTSFDDSHIYELVQTCPTIKKLMMSKLIQITDKARKKKKKFINKLIINKKN